MRSSVSRAMPRASSSPFAACSRSSSSMVEAAGNFGAGPKPPSCGSKLRRESRHDPAQKAARQRLCRRRLFARLPDRVHEDVGLLLELVAAHPVGLGDRLQHLREARHPVARLRREVGAAVERAAVRREEDGHRPPAVPGHGDDGVHVQAVDVGPLLAVDLDGDEVLVHQPSRAVVLEGLVLHDVAPVAGRVADRKEHRAVLLSRPGKRFLAPGIPVHRVGGVLEQVGARLGSQAVHGISLARGGEGAAPAPPGAGAARRRKARRRPARARRRARRRSSRSHRRSPSGTRARRPRRLPRTRRQRRVGW